MSKQKLTGSGTSQSWQDLSQIALHHFKLKIPRKPLIFFSQSDIEIWVLNLNKQTSTAPGFKAPFLILKIKVNHLYSKNRNLYNRCLFES